MRTCPSATTRRRTSEPNAIAISARNYTRAQQYPTRACPACGRVHGAHTRITSGSAKRQVDVCTMKQYNSDAPLKKIRVTVAHALTRPHGSCAALSTVAFIVSSLHRALFRGGHFGNNSVRKLGARPPGRRLARSDHSLPRAPASPAAKWRANLHFSRRATLLRSRSSRWPIFSARDPGGQAGSAILVPTLSKGLPSKISPSKQQRSEAISLSQPRRRARCGF